MMCKAFIYRATAYMTAVAMFANCFGFFISDLIITLRSQNNVDL